MVIAVPVIVSLGRAIEIVTTFSSVAFSACSHGCIASRSAAVIIVASSLATRYGVCTRITGENTFSWQGCGHSQKRREENKGRLNHFVRIMIIVPVVFASLDAG
jgi:hypothetical protein